MNIMSNNEKIYIIKVFKVDQIVLLEELIIIKNFIVMDLIKMRMKKLLKKLKKN